MQLIIHRGTQEIGGSCVELRSSTSRLVIDFGIPLVSSKNEPFDAKSLEGKSIHELQELKILPEIDGLYAGEQKGIDAILLSHSHLDHYGFLKYVHPDIPIYVSEGAKQMVEVSTMFTPFKIGELNCHVMNNKKKICVGDFEIVSYVVDHSAFDARAFLIEAGGKRVFYSGDFRGHGRKGSLFKRMVENPPPHIDCLLMEGSMLGRGTQHYVNEIEIEKKITQTLQERKNITFLFASSQNIDRIVSAYRACLKTQSIFVIDIYTAFILEKLRKVSKNIPQFNWKNVRIKFIKCHADCLVKAGYRGLLYMFNKRKIDMFAINRQKERILMLARDNSIFPRLAKEIEGIQGAKILYSMWAGYLTDEFKHYCSAKGIIIEQVHTSGHATVDDLQTFARAINPKTLIPIHTFHGNDYPTLFNNVKVLRDNELYDI